jgi:hypothetical protein
MYAVVKYQIFTELKVIPPGLPSLQALRLCEVTNLTLV